MNGADLAPLVSARGLARIHPRSDGAVIALDHIDFSARAGDMVAVVGRSGSGKTTLLTLLGLLDRPSAGRILLEGRDVSGLSPGRLARLRRGRIGYLFQDGGLIERMRVLDTVLLPMRYGRIASETRKTRAMAALDAVGLADKAARRVEELSGGERQRAGLARALAPEPALLICDEPTAALDKNTSELVATRLRAHADAGGCVIVATHDPLILPHAHRVVAFEAGRVVPDTATA